jgi:hypothetical protein
MYASDACADMQPLTCHLVQHPSAFCMQVDMQTASTHIWVRYREHKKPFTGMLQYQEDGVYQLQHHSSCQAVSNAMALFLDWQPTSSSSIPCGSSQPTRNIHEDVEDPLPSSTATPTGDACDDDADDIAPTSSPTAAPAPAASGSSSGSSEAVISSSGGGISRVKLGEAGMDVVDEWQAHDLEAWAAVYDLHQVGLLLRRSSCTSHACRSSHLH